jgi:hypothetical protein
MKYAVPSRVKRIAGSHGWARDVIRLADEEFGHWVLATIDADEMLNIMLPHHTHRAELAHQLVPQRCSTVSEAISVAACVPNRIIAAKTRATRVTSVGHHERTPQNLQELRRQLRCYDFWSHPTTIPSSNVILSP